MKIFLFIILFVAASFNSFAVVHHQGAWRWRADNGSETNATWLANENKMYTINTINLEESIRLRIEIVNEDDENAFEFDNNILQYTAGDDQWVDITGISTSGDWMLAGSSDYVNDLKSTTQQLNGFYNDTFQTGGIFVLTDIYAYSLAVNSKTEFEWVIKPTVNVKPGTTYNFRLSGDLDYPHPLPSLLTEEVLPVTLSYFAVQPDGKRVKIMWTTASEQNNDRFEVMRSANGKDNWQIVATQKGSGTTTQPHTYTVYDEHPLAGKNYYRLKQYDFDGKVTLSHIQFATMQLLKPILKVYPNPTNSPVWFTISNYQGKITAILTDVTGKIIHTEEISVGFSNSTYHLYLKNNPAPGIYVLQVKGEGISESIKVVVQK